jgi:hypothetical protein
LVAEDFGVDVAIGFGLRAPKTQNVTSPHTKSTPKLLHTLYTTLYIFAVHASPHICTLLSL